MLRKMPTSIIKQQRVGSQQQRHTIRQIQANEREKKVRGIEIRHCPVSTVFIAHFLFAANENLNNFVAIFFHCFYFNMKHWCCEGDATFKYNVWNKWGKAVKRWRYQFYQEIILYHEMTFPLSFRLLFNSFQARIFIASAYDSFHLIFRMRQFGSPLFISKRNAPTKVLNNWIKRIMWIKCVRVLKMPNLLEIIEMSNK